ncbi:helix-turn-helix domain-containing protein [Sphingobacterium detergens]
MESEYEKSLEKEFEKFLEALGQYLKQERENQGFNSVLPFANILDIDVSTIGKYERGQENLTVKRLYTLLRGLAKSHDQILKFFSISHNSQKEQVSKSFSEAQELQVRTQVKKYYGQELDSHHLARIHQMLTACFNHPIKKTVLRDGLSLKTYTKHFNQCLEICIQANWIQMTKQGKRKSNDQKYFTTIEGKRLLITK